jgi:hypothetical protein
MKIVLENNQKLFFTSDTHYAHNNIVRWRIGAAPIVREIAGSIPALTTNT